MSNNQLYAGQSDDLKRRFKEHHNGLVKSTKPNRPVELIYYEAFKSKDDAKRREIYFKTSQGKKMLKLIIRDSIK